MKFNDLDLSVNSDTKEIEFNGQKIKVKQYVGAADKNSIIVHTLNECTMDNGNFNPVLFDVWSAINICICYTDIEFIAEGEDGQPFDVLGAYDSLKSSGLLDSIIAAIPSEEIDYINDCASEMMADADEDSRSIVKTILAMRDELPELFLGMQQGFNAAMGSLQTNDDFESDANLEKEQ